MVQSISLCRGRRLARFPLIQHTSPFCFFKSRNAYCFSQTLEYMMQFAVYLEVIKRNTDDVASGTRQHHPPVCQELACRTIRDILPQNSLKICLANSRHSKESELALAQNQTLCPTSVTLGERCRHHTWRE